MAVLLDILAGSLSGRIRGEAGQSLRAGSASDADLLLPGDAPVALRGDAPVAPLHFVLQCGERAARLFAKGSPQGVVLNGQPAVEAELRHGDRIEVGQTTLFVSIVPEVAGEAPPPHCLSTWEAPSGGPAALDDFARLLEVQSAPLYALVDAARDAGVLRLVRELEGGAHTLYTGSHAGRLADYAPYLVPLSGRAALLDRLLREGWAKGWGIYLTSCEPVERLLACLRRLLIVEDAEGRTLYFRYYDPRVLRNFFPVCSGAQADLFFDAAGSILLEGETPGTLLRYTRARAQG